MFRALASLIIVSICSTACKAQDDRSFPNDGAYWDIVVWEPFPFPEQTAWPQALEYQHDPQIQLDGRSWGTVHCSTESEPIGLIAVDSGRVLFRSTGDYSWTSQGSGYFDTTAQVLYDFNLMVGETAYQESEPVIVAAVDTIQLFGQSRKHLLLSNEDEWIEGVGSIHGLMRPFAPTFGLGAIGYTMVGFCGYYIDPDSLQYTICLPTAIAEYRSSVVSLAPNPTTGSFTLRSDVTQGTFSIRTMSGSIIHRGRITGRETQVEVLELPRGVYMVQLEDRCAKLVVQ